LGNRFIVVQDSWYADVASNNGYRNFLTQPSTEISGTNSIAQFTRLLPLILKSAVNAGFRSESFCQLSYLPQKVFC